VLDDPALSADAIRAAHRPIHPAFRNSPQFVHDGLSARLGVPVIVKVETVNPIRSFKGRGTWVVIEALVRDGVLGPERPVVCASAGNFGQGVAFAAGPAGVRSVVFASTRANRGKLARMRALGADVREVGDDFDAAVAAARAYAAESGALMLVDGDDTRISTGAATIALEVTEAAARGELPSPAVFSVPVGNGALINGIGSWLRHAAPACRVVGVQAELAPAMTLSWRAGHAIDTEAATTYADGIAARVSIPLAVRLMDGRVDDMVLVPEAALHEAQAELTEALGITVEGAAAASWAALLAEPRPDGPAVVIVTGSNV
jgi:threonine dehydratase